MSDVNFQQLSTVQNQQMPQPVTIVTAATIAPSTFVSFITGTTQIATITPFVTGQHMICLIFNTTQNGQFATTGNLTVNGTTATALVPQFLVYSPTTGKYYGKAA